MKSSLEAIAYGRSGDKGNSANIGIIAYTPAGYEYLRRELTTERVAAYFSGLDLKEVIRYEWSGLGALNFLLLGALGGGGSRSLRLDSQGKCLAQQLLAMPLELSEADLASMERRKENK